MVVSATVERLTKSTASLFLSVLKFYMKLWTLEIQCPFMDKLEFGSMVDGLNFSAIFTRAAMFLDLRLYIQRLMKQVTGAHRMVFL